MQESYLNADREIGLPTMPRIQASEQEDMRLSVSEHNRVPLYHQLYLILRSKIHDGEYPPTAFLPGEHELANKYSVSRITAVRALNELAASGLVVRQQGRGTRVLAGANATVMRGPTETLRAAPGSYVDIDSPGHIQHSQHEISKVLRFELVPSPIEVATALDLEAGETVLFIERLRLFDAQPFSHLQSFLHQDYHAKWKGDPLTQSVASLLESAGVHLARVHEKVTATLADDISSALFSIPVGSPLLKITKTAFDEHDKPIEYSIATYPPEQYQYQVTVVAPAIR